MSDIKTGLMFSPLTEKVYWGKMNTKTGVSVGNNQKDITSDFIGTMLQKFPINTRQNIVSNGKTECVVMVLDEEKAMDYINAKEENAKLKADKAELLKALNGVMNIVAVSDGVDGYHCNGDVACWWDFDEIAEVSDLIQKHKTQ